VKGARLPIGKKPIPGQKDPVFITAPASPSTSPRVTGAMTIGAVATSPHWEPHLALGCRPTIFFVKVFFLHQLFRSISTVNDQLRLLNLSFMRNVCWARRIPPPGRPPDTFDKLYLWGLVEYAMVAFFDADMLALDEPVQAPLSQAPQTPSPPLPRGSVS